MMNINVNRPMSPQQLAALYANNPMQADFDMPAQARGFVHEQASRMGIMSPANHFATLQQNAVNTAALSGGGWAQQEAAKQALVDKMPSHAPATTNYSSPLALAEAKRLGMTPSQFATDMKLRNAGVQNVMGPQVRFNNATPQDLENDPRFRRALRDHPDQAAKLFSTVTGNDYNKYLEQRTAMSADRLKFQRDAVQEKLKRGEWKLEGGKMMSRKLVPNPSGTGEMILSDAYSPLDETENQMFNPDTRAAVIDPQADLFHALQAKKNAVAPDLSMGPARSQAELAPLQIPSDAGGYMGHVMNQAYEALPNMRPDFAPAINSFQQGDYTDALRQAATTINPIPKLLGAIPGVAETGNMFDSMGKKLVNTFMPAFQAAGIQPDARPYQSQGMLSDRADDPKRRRAHLANHPQFQQLLQTDPKRALAILSALNNQRNQE